jgi:hypothetical protein
LPSFILGSKINLILHPCSDTLQANWKPGKLQTLSDTNIWFWYNQPDSPIFWKQLTTYCSTNLGPGRRAKIYSDSLWSWVFQPPFSRGFWGWPRYWGTSNKWLLS